MSEKEEQKLIDIYESFQKRVLKLKREAEGLIEELKIDEKDHPEKEVTMKQIREQVEKRYKLVLEAEKIAETVFQSKKSTEGEKRTYFSLIKYLI